MSVYVRAIIVINHRINAMLLSFLCICSEKDTVTAMFWHPSSNTLFLGTNSGKVRCCKVDALSDNLLEVTFEVRPHKDRVTAIAYSTSLNRIVSISRDKHLALIEIGNYLFITQKVASHWLVDMACDDSNQLVFVATIAQDIICLTLQTASSSTGEEGDKAVEVKRWKCGGHGSIRRLAHHPSSQQHAYALYACTWSGAVIPIAVHVTPPSPSASANAPSPPSPPTITLEIENPLRDAKQHGKSRTCAWLNGMGQLATGGDDGMIRLWNVNSSRIEQIVRHSSTKLAVLEPFSYVCAVSNPESGDVEERGFQGFCSGGKEGKLCIWHAGSSAGGGGWEETIV